MVHWAGPIKFAAATKISVATDLHNNNNLNNAYTVITTFLTNNTNQA